MLFIAGPASNYFAVHQRYHEPFNYFLLNPKDIYPQLNFPLVSVTQSCLTVIPWTVAHQAPLSMEFSWQEYWSGLPCPSPGDLPDQGIEPGSPAL